MKFPLTLLVFYLLVFMICAIAPFDRVVWVAENAPIVMLVAGIVLVSRKFRFSNTAYFLMFILPVLHTIGGHYTFERVPFGFVSDLFGFERNHYDRMAHFTVGFFAFPLSEYFARRGIVRGKLYILAMPVAIILALAGAYEIFEWQYAVLGDPEAGAAVLGSQGDQWDAQKDMLADTLGSIVAVGLYAATRLKKDSGGKEGV